MAESLASGGSRLIAAIGHPMVVAHNYAKTLLQTPGHERQLDKVNRLLVARATEIKRNGTPTSKKGSH